MLKNEIFINNEPTLITMKIGITGIFCSGKTTVAKLFEKKGYKNINADNVGHKLLNKKEIKNKVIKEFGKKICL